MEGIELHSDTGLLMILLLNFFTCRHMLFCYRVSLPCC